MITTINAATNPNLYQAKRNKTFISSFLEVLNHLKIATAIIPRRIITIQPPILSSSFKLSFIACLEFLLINSPVEINWALQCGQYSASLVTPPPQVPHFKLGINFPLIIINISAFTIQANTF